MAACDDQLLGCVLELEAGKGELNDTGLKSEQNACSNSYKACVYETADNHSGADTDGDGEVDVVAGSSDASGGYAGGGDSSGGGGWCDRARTHMTKAGISESSIDSEMNGLGCSSHKY